MDNSYRGQVTAIEAHKGWMPVNFREMWAYRELLYFMVWRDIKVRYKQTLVGFGWAIIQPVGMMVIFSLFFGILAKIPSGDIPYPLFSYAGLLPWTLFANGTSRASLSLVQEANLIQKVYFPRLIVPLSGILAPLADFLVAFLVLVGLMLYFGYPPMIGLLLLPALILVELMLTAGIGFWLSAINVEYRDVAYVIPFLIQLLLFASPVIYSSTFVPARFQFAYGILNPMSGIIEGFRWAILGTKAPGYLLIPSIGISVIVFVSGMFYFRNRERAFADVV